MLSRADVRAFRWALKEAKTLRGLHTGNREKLACFDVRIQRAEMALKRAHEIQKANKKK